MNPEFTMLKSDAWSVRVRNKDTFLFLVCQCLVFLFFNWNSHKTCGPTIIQLLSEEVSPDFLNDASLKLTDSENDECAQLRKSYKLQKMIIGEKGQNYGRNCKTV